PDLARPARADDRARHVRFSRSVAGWPGALRGARRGKRDGARARARGRALRLARVNAERASPTFALFGEAAIPDRRGVEGPRANRDELAGGEIAIERELVVRLAREGEGIAVTVAAERRIGLVFPGFDQRQELTAAGAHGAEEGEVEGADAAACARIAAHPLGPVEAVDEVVRVA